MFGRAFPRHHSDSRETASEDAFRRFTATGHRSWTRFPIQSAFPRRCRRQSGCSVESPGAPLRAPSVRTGRDSYRCRLDLDHERLDRDVHLVGHQSAGDVDTPDQAKSRGLGRRRGSEPRSVPGPTPANQGTTGVPTPGAMTVPEELVLAETGRDSERVTSETPPDTRRCRSPNTRLSTTAPPPAARPRCWRRSRVASTRRQGRGRQSASSGAR